MSRATKTQSGTLLELQDSLSGHILITSMFALFTYLRPAAAATTSFGGGVGLSLNDPARETYLWKTVIYLSRGSDLNFLNCQVLKNVIGLNI